MASGFGTRRAVEPSAEPRAREFELNARCGLSSTLCRSPLPRSGSVLCGCLPRKARGSLETGCPRRQRARAPVALMAHLDGRQRSGVRVL